MERKQEKDNLKSIVDAVQSIPITREAERIVYGDREETYDAPDKNFQKIALIWSGILDIEVTPEKVGLCMIGVKMARESHKHQEDNLVDICGYALCIDRVHEEEKGQPDNG